MGEPLLLLTLDFETYYTTKERGGYSLTYMTTEEYVRSPLFEIVGFSIKKGNGVTQWYTGTLEYLRSVLRALPWHRIWCIGHNMSEFDSFILTEVIGVHPAMWGCTLQMARAIHGGKQSKSLAMLAMLHGLKQKGNQVKTYVNMRRQDFTPWQLQDYGVYCCDDTDICYALFQLYVRFFSRQELMLAHLSTKMFAQPKLALDNALLQVMQQDALVRKTKMMERVAEIIGVDSRLMPVDRMLQTQKLLRKDEVLANVLRAYDIEPPTKLSPKKRNADGSPMRVYAFAKTDEGMQELLEYEDESAPLEAEDIQALAAARLSVKSTIAETRINRFLGISERGLLPTPLVFGKVHTHRLAGGQKINLQNLSGVRKVDIKTPLGTLIRTPHGMDRLADYHTVTGQVKCANGQVYSNAGQQACYTVSLRDGIVAPEGKRIVVADSAQIELRCCHLLAGQMDTVAELRAGVDVYSTFASTFYGRPITKADEMERKHGKVAMLQLQYQSGWKTFQRAARTQGGVRLNEDQAASTVQVYRARFSEIPKFWRAAQMAIPQMAAGGAGYLDQWGLIKIDNGKLSMPGRLPLNYENLRMEMLERFDGSGEMEQQWVYDDKEKRSMKRIYGGSVTENVNQWLGRHVVSDQKLEIERKYGTYERTGDGVSLMVHDEVVAVVDEDRADECLAFMLDVMGESPAWWPQLPVKAEGGHGVRYSECK